MIKLLMNIFKRNNNSMKITVFPKGTIVKYNGIPCELLQDVAYYSETFND